MRGWWVWLGHGIKVALDFFSFTDEVFLLVKKWIIIDYRIVTPNMLTAWAAISWWMRVTSAWVRTLFICLIINEISKLKCATKTGLCLYFLPLPRFEQNFQLKFKDLVENVNIFVIRWINRHLYRRQKFSDVVPSKIYFLKPLTINKTLICDCANAVTTGAQLDILLWGGQGGNISWEARKFFLPPPPLNIFRGGQEKCVLYSNNKKLTLPTGYCSVVSFF